MQQALGNKPQCFFELPAPEFIMLCSEKTLGRWLKSAALILFCVSLAAVRADTNIVFQPLKVNKLVGMKVEDRDGQEIGKMRDIVVDMQTGQIKFVILASGGFWGVGVKLKAVPPQIISAATSKRHTLAANIPGSNWDKAPAVKRSAIISLAQPEQARTINKFYGQTEIAQTNRSGNLAATGYETNRQMQSGSQTFKLASELVGKKVVNRQQEKIGEVLDLLIGFNHQQPTLAIVSAGGFLHGHEQNYAIPLTALSLKGEQLVVDANRTLLDHARTLDQKIWRSSNGSSTEIFRFKEVKAPKAASENL
jgi:sporulation protein YlmC with PRC-barrel domain